MLPPPLPAEEMSWFNASQLSSFAKQALSQAQKSIDRVLDIQEEEPSAWAETIPYGEPGKGERGGGLRGLWARGGFPPVADWRRGVSRDPSPLTGVLSRFSLASPSPNAHPSLSGLLFAGGKAQPRFLRASGPGCGSCRPSAERLAISWASPPPWLDVAAAASVQKVQLMRTAGLGSHDGKGINRHGPSGA